MFHHSHTTAAQAAKTKGRTIRWASRYDLFVNVLSFGLGKAIREMTAELAQIREGDLVLDVGCGTGDLTLVAKRLAGAGGRVGGIDAAPEMIEVARRKAARAHADVDFRVGLIEAIDYPDATFDVVLSSLMMHHLPGDVKSQGLREVGRVLKPGGRLLIVDIKRPTGILSHLTPMLLAHAGLRDGIQDLPELLRLAGFVAVKSGDTRFGPLGYTSGRTNPQ
jgi:ubiquinone/menaquinone biosynthesis C-methylase UbiE